MDHITRKDIDTVKVPRSSAARDLRLLRFVAVLLTGCCPAKVIRAVVRLDPVDVIHTVCFRWARAMECTTYNLRNSKYPSARWTTWQGNVETDVQISICIHMRTKLVASAEAKELTVAGCTV